MYITPLLTLARGYSFCPLLMSVSEAFSIPFIFNKTLLHKSSERSSLISGPGLNSSLLQAKNPSVFSWVSNNLSPPSLSPSPCALFIVFDRLGSFLADQGPFVGTTSLGMLSGGTGSRCPVSGLPTLLTCLTSVHLQSIRACVCMCVHMHA